MLLSLYNILFLLLAFLILMSGVFFVGTQHSDSGYANKEHILRTKVLEGKPDRAENVTHVKPDPGNVKSKGGSSANGSDVPSSVSTGAAQGGASRAGENQKPIDESAQRALDETVAKSGQRNTVDAEVLFTFSLWAIFNIFTLKYSI